MPAFPPPQIPQWPWASSPQTQLAFPANNTNKEPLCLCRTVWRVNTAWMDLVLAEQHPQTQPKGTSTSRQFATINSSNSKTMGILALPMAAEGRKRGPRFFFAFYKINLNVQSALLENGIAPNQQRQHQPRKSAEPMQSSCYGAIAPIPPANGPLNGGLSQHQQIQQQQAAMAAFHQQMDPVNFIGFQFINFSHWQMSMSLPNVLAPSALQTDHCCFYAPLKSMSGENFHVMEQRRRETDNQSEGLSKENQKIK